MRIKRFVLAGIGMFCAILTVKYLHHLQEEHVHLQSHWKVEAEDAFVQALNLEVAKRSGMDVPFVSINSPQKRKLVEPVPDSVTLESEYGIKTYPISKEKFEYSLVKEKCKRMMLSVLLEDFPMSADTLNRQWDSLLAEKRIPVGTRIRYSVTDLLGYTSVKYSKQEGKTVARDSLLSRYMGFRCEMAVTGFVSYGGWLALDAVQWFLLLLPWGFLLVLIVSYDALCARLKCKFSKREVIFMEKKVVVERKVRVVDEEVKATKLYELATDTFFDSERSVIIKDGLVVRKVAPQASVLLKLFFNTPGHLLIEEEICREMWPGTGNSTHLHAALYRLRKVLKGVSALDVCYEGDGACRLKTPFSSEKTVVSLEDSGTNWH